MNLSRVLRFVAFGLLLGALGAAWQAGWFARVASVRGLVETVQGFGPWAYVGFVVAYTVLQPFGVPGSIFIVAAPLIWPWPTAFALSMAGTMGASVVGFSFARFVARDFVVARIPARLRKYDDALARHAFLTVVVLRLLLWMPQPLHWFFGVSRVSFATHFAGSLLGYVPPLLVVSLFASSMFDASGAMRPAATPVLIGLVVAALLIALTVRVVQRALGRAPRSPPPARV